MCPARHSSYRDRCEQRVGRLTRSTLRVRYGSSETLEMGLTEGAAARLAEAAAGADSWFAIYSKLCELVPNGEEQAHRGLVWAFAFDLIGPGDEERRAREGSPYGAFLEYDGGRLPPRLADVPDSDVASWRAAFEVADDARVLSRLGDLLWERRDLPRPDEKARRACEALLSLADVDLWSPMETTDGLVRALEVSREISDVGLAERVVGRIVQAIGDELAIGAERPGVSFNLLRALVGLPADARPDCLLDVIDRAEQVYAGDPHQVESAIELKASVAGPEEVRGLRERQALLWRDQGRQATGILKSAFLERALDVARTHGFADLARELRVELQNITDDEMGLKLVSAEVKVPSEQVDAYINRFVRFDDWRDSLMAFGIHGPPGGEPEALQARVDEMRAAHPFQFLVTRTIIDADFGVAIFHATDAASHDRAAVADQYLLATRIWATFAVTVLERLVETYGRPEQDELVEFFTTDLIPPATAARIAHAFDLYWSGATDDSAHVLCPRLETVLRELARRVGLPITREPIGDQPGGWRSVGDLLHAMQGRLPTAGWRAYLIHLLVDPLGLNLRNVIAHGVRETIDIGDAALLLHAACFLRLVQVSDAPQVQPLPGARAR